jgi:hypothetical protein
MKDWENIDDNEFDKTFRESAGSFEEPLWPEAWSLMEEKFDEKDKKRRIIVFWRWAAAVFAILTAGLIGNAYLNNAEKKEILTQNKPQTSATVDKEKSTGSNNNLGEQLKNNNKENTQSNNSNINKEKSVTPLVDQKIFEGSKSILKANNDVKIAINKNSKKTPKEKIIREISKNYIAQNPIRKIEKSIEDDRIETNIIENLIIKKEEKPTPELPKSELGINSLEEKVTANDNIKSVLEVDEDTLIVAMEETSLDENTGLNEMKPPKSSVLQRLSFNLGFSPDFSKAEDSPLGKTGYNFQLLLNYKISNKLTFKAGAMKSLKLYDAIAGYYAWPARWGVPSSPLTYVSASCNMWDFPVSFSYDFKEKGKNKYYTSMGITNYKMVKEVYNYHYENDADPNLKWRKWQGSTGFYGAGVLNFSVGLEHKISNRLSVQIEPFVKVPIKSVGFGSVKLFSTGLFMNVKLPTLKK